jgi:SprT protein
MTEKDLKIFQKYLPETAVEYCAKLWDMHKFNLKITKPRHSKLGDYCYNPAKGHCITVNANLNKYAFLITYLHEVAHLQVQKTYIRRRLPHGKEWKEAFRQLLLSVMTEAIFPKNILAALQLYYKNPAASSNGHAPLANALSQYDAVKSDEITLNEIPDNGRFILNTRVFQKGPLRRTRYLCRDLANNKQYVILSRAVVKKID